MREIVLGTIAFIVSLVVIFKVNIRLGKLLNKKELFFLYSYKVLAGIALTLVYTFFYPDRSLADTFRYFDESYWLHQLFFESKADFLGVFLGYKAEMKNEVMYLNEMNNWFPPVRSPLYNDNRTIIRINAVLRFISFGSYYFHLVVFCMMGFLGQLLVYKSISSYVKGLKYFVLLGLFIVPSVVFWSSGNLKEGPLFLAMGCLMMLLENMRTKGLSWKKGFVLAMLFFITFHLKFYVGLLFVPIISLYLLKLKKPNWSWIKLIGLNYGAYFLLANIWHFVRFKWSLFTVFKWKRKDFEGLGEIMNAGSVIRAYELEDNALSFLLNMPQGLFNALFRPFLWESHNYLMVFSAVENVVVFLFLILCFVYRKKEKMSDTMVLLLVYSVTLLTVIGMVTPIAGSLVRYKIPAVPLLIIVFASMADWDRIKMIFNKRNTI